MTRAIIYTSATDYARSVDRCIDYIREHGYKFKGLVQDWDVVKRMLIDDECSVAIIATPEELDPDRKPRLEFVSHPPQQPGKAANGGRNWDERTRVIRRGTWEA